MQFEKREIAILTGMLGLSFLIRFLLFPLQGYQNDMNTFISWFNTAAESGPRAFYSVVSWCDYPPFNIYLFWGFGSLAQVLNLFGTQMISYIVKLVPNLFDMAIAAVIFFFVRKQLSFKQSLVASALYAFNPAVIFNAAVWGQFDAIYTFFLLLSLILAFKNKPEFSAVAFAVGVLTKPQAIALLPLVAFLIFKKSGVKRLLFSVVAFIATVFVVILPMQSSNPLFHSQLSFGLNSFNVVSPIKWSNPVTFLSNIYFGAYGGYAFTSVNAFNLWGMFGLWIPDGNLFLLGWGMFGAITAFTLYVVNKRWRKSNTEMLVIYAAFMLFFSFFMLPTRIHERYLFPAISMLALLFPFVKKTRPLYVALTATLLVNVGYVLYWLNLYVSLGYDYGPNLSGDPVVLVVCIVNLIMFLYALLLMWDELKGKSALKIETSTISMHEERGNQDETEIRPSS